MLYRLDSFLLSRAQRASDRLSQISGNQLTKFSLEKASALMAAAAFVEAFLLGRESGGVLNAVFGPMAFFYFAWAIAVYVYVTREERRFYRGQSMWGGAFFTSTARILSCGIYGTCTIVILATPFTLISVALLIGIVGLSAWPYFTSCEPYPRSRGLLVA